MGIDGSSPISLHIEGGLRFRTARGLSAAVCKRLRKDGRGFKAGNDRGGGAPEDVLLLHRARRGEKKKWDGSWTSYTYDILLCRYVRIR